MNKVLSGETIGHIKKKMYMLYKQMLACSAMRVPDFTLYVMMLKRSRLM